MAWETDSVGEVSDVADVRDEVVLEVVDVVVEVVELVEVVVVVVLVVLAVDATTGAVELALGLAMLTIWLMSIGCTVVLATAWGTLELPLLDVLMLAEVLADGVVVDADEDAVVIVVVFVVLVVDPVVDDESIGCEI